MQDTKQIFTFMSHKNIFFKPKTNFDWVQNQDFYRT
jgi:hypothetical protein